MRVATTFGSLILGAGLCAARITNIVENGGFEDSTIDPWEATGAIPEIARGLCPEGDQCLRLPGNFDQNTAKVCQRVEVEQGYEYTFKALVSQNCIKSFGSNIVVCEDNVNTAELSIDGVFNSGESGVTGFNTYNDFSHTFPYVGPSIDSTDLCITITANQGVSYSFNVDSASLTRGKAVPIPVESEV
ncbi:hypothetical protein IL306_006026 [Fusarium sp. DS 682]|nr:hypothetical protein IL306_006026 [Fusarium sp. DS 682]